jgi:2-polyprenyl-6-methoxyphenol hydroxylase-like FAD-dependent oxidoreductase
MPYTYPIDADAMFEDRFHQFVGFGLPAADVERVRAATTDFWNGGAGGWVHEFSRLGGEYADQQRFLLASLAFGCAKFPCLADEARAAALAQQRRWYELAAPTFPVRFERRVLHLAVGAATVALPVHLFTSAGRPGEQPVLVFSGGVDTWKMDVHHWCTALAEHGGVTVLAFDLPGTGENPVLLGPDSDALVQSLVTEARGIGNGLVAHLGISFGGNFSALTGLTGTVDAAVVLGGPVAHSFHPDTLRRLPYGMADIVGNAMGFDHPVTVDELAAAGAPLDREELLRTATTNAPMLVVNGADDYFVPAHDTLVFRDRAEVSVDLIEGTGHCAMTQAEQVLPRIVAWLRDQLGVPAAPPVEQARAGEADPTDVLVVGAGPVGLVLACELARRQVRVRVVDKLRRPTVESRAILVHARSLELLERLGVAEQVIASGVRTEGMQLHADGQILADLPFGTVDSPYPFSVSTAQTETERILTARLVELGGSVERGVELLTFEQGESEVRCRLAHADGRIEETTTGWVVGTDGSHSTVRAQTGQRLEGSFVGERFLLGDVDADHDLPRDRTHSFFGVGGGPLLIFPMLGRRVRVVAQVTDSDDETTVDRLQSVVDERTSGFRIRAARWLTVFEIHHAQVPQYRVGRAFLAGDAAHVHSPAGGQGMNTGMQDAFNLGWKLAAVVHGHADQPLLDSYHTERHPVAARVIRQTTRITTVGTLDHRLARELRNRALRLVGRLAPVRRLLADQLEETDLTYRTSPVVAGTSRRGGLRPGDHAPHVPGTGLDELLAAAEETVAVVFGRLGAEAADALAGLRQIQVDDGTVGSVDQTSSRAVVADPGGRIARRYRTRPGDVVLIRPDGYIGYLGSLDDEPTPSAITRYRSTAGCARSALTTV